MLNAPYEHLPPHQTPAARHPSADLFPRSGKALLANQRTREHVLDVQYREPDIGARAFPGEAACDQARGDLDDSGASNLDSLCSAGVGCVLVVDTRARRWARGCVDCVEPGRDGSNGVALGVWVVFGRAGVVAISDGAGVECESRPRRAAGVGWGVSLVLELLAGSYRGDSFDAVVIRSPPLEHLAL